MEKQSVVILGCGNVASYFAERFKELGFAILQVYHPDLKKAQNFANLYKSEAIDKLKNLNKQADIFFIAVKDSFIEHIAKELPLTSGIVLHTSGAIQLEVLKHHARAAVFYPLQTFTKGIKTAHQNFPLLIECKVKNDENYLEQVAVKLGMQVYFMNSHQRTEIHLAAVFAANFANHCIKVGYDLMKFKNHPPELLLPLIKESINKLNYISPSQAQTGPAIRNDEVTIQKHLELLTNNTAIKLLYEILTKNIQSSNS
jgi:predicted short-subunit dehydrogenase-like oxidoreductase (DUF2520 family)